MTFYDLRVRSSESDVMWVKPRDHSGEPDQFDSTLALTLSTHSWLTEHATSIAASTQHHSKAAPTFHKFPSLSSLFSTFSLESTFLIDYLHQFDPRAVLHNTKPSRQ